MVSLERRLQYTLAGIFVLILVGLLAIANISTRNMLQEFVTSRLEHDARSLLEVLNLESSLPKVGWRRVNPIYNKPLSGHYYSIKINDETLIRSPSLQDEKLPLKQDTDSFIQHSIPGPQGQLLIVLTRKYEKNGQAIEITVAEDMSLLKQKRTRFSWLFIIMGIVGIFLMLTMLRLIIRHLFLSLDQTRSEVRQIESGENLQLSEDVPLEIYPLVKEFNHSLSLMQKRLERSRNSLGNLAHALKTPLSLLVQQLDSGSLGLESNNNQQAKLQAERIRQLTERELKRARMAGLGNTTQRFDPREELPTLVEVLKQAHQKDKLEVNVVIADDISVFGDREDMLELLGNLLDNAYKWAESQVSCSIFTTKETERITILIEDDGTGRTLKELEQLTQRGIRLDESVEGHGLGLAICKDIVKLYAGTIRFDRSEKLGGFLVEINLP